MTKLLQSIISLFATPNQQTQLENYINSKNPSTPAEVDYWARRFEANQASTNWGYTK